MKGETKPGNRRHRRRLDSRENATPVRFFVSTGLESTLRTAGMDKRSKMYHVYATYCGELIQHLGGESETTTPMRELVDQESRLRLLASLCWAEILRSGFMNESGLTPAFMGFMNVSRERRELLKLLGLERHARELSVEEFIASAGKKPDAPT